MLATRPNQVFVIDMVDSGEPREFRTVGLAGLDLGDLDL
jgi:hypothetical protein